MDDLMKIIGDRIRNLRREKGWSQEDLALRANINRSYFGQLERGEKTATIETLNKIACALNITLEEMFKHIQPPCETKDTTTLSLLINRLNSLSVEEQKIMLGFLDLLTLWKKN